MTPSILLAKLYRGEQMNEYRIQPVDIVINRETLDLKLVVWRGTPPNKLVNVDWQSSNSCCTWLSTGWAPSEENYLPSGNFVGGERGFPQIATAFIPRGCLVYAEISGAILSETELMVRDIEGRHLQCRRPLVMKRVWKRLFKGIAEPGDSLFVEADGDFVYSCFDKYASWMSDSWTFLVSRTPLTNWAELLRYASRGGIITSEFLQQVELLFVNRWEHGFEVLTCKLNYDQLKDMARTASKNLNWTFVEAPDSSRETLQSLKVW